MMIIWNLKMKIKFLKKKLTLLRIEFKKNNNPKINNKNSEPMTVM